MFTTAWAAASLCVNLAIKIISVLLSEGNQMTIEYKCDKCGVDDGYHCLAVMESSEEAEALVGRIYELFVSS